MYGIRTWDKGMFRDVDPLRPRTTFRAICPWLGAFCFWKAGLLIGPKKSRF